MREASDVLRDGAVIEAHPASWRPWPWLWPVLYPLAWVALFFVSSVFWFLPAGLRLGMLWILPRTAWWKMAAVEFTGILALSLTTDSHQTSLGMLAGAVLPWCIYALVVRGIGRHGRRTPTSIALPRLLACGALAAMLTGLALTAIQLNDTGALEENLATALTGYALGDFTGMLIVVPVMLALHDQSGPNRRRWSELFGNGLVLIPLMIALGLSQLPRIKEPVYPLILALLPMFAISYRLGWRQGAIAHLLLVPGVVTLSAPLVELWDTGQLQVLLGMSAFAALLLGATAENQRGQHAALTAAMETLSMRSRQLTGAANRIAILQEEERRRIGAELHDQLGQDMTAIATRLRIVERTAKEPDLQAALTSINALVSDAHTHLREAIESLHPAVLDRFGLARALAEGPVAELMRDHGLQYKCTIQGQVDRLPDNITFSLYRICQESTSNSVRHGCGGHVHIRLSLLPGEGGAQLNLLIEDRAGALSVNTVRPGRGLLNIRDRAEAIGATYSFHTESGSPRHALQLWVPA